MTKGVVKLKDYRHKKRLTQEEFADIVGVSRSVIALLETRNNYNLSVTTAKKIADVIGIKWNLFFEVE